jgi:hypothetical protein
MIFQRLSDFHRAKNWRPGVVPKNQGATITCGQAQEFAFGLSKPELLGSPHDLLQFLQLLALLA